MACLAVMAFSAMSAKISQFTFVEVCYTHVLLNPSPSSKVTIRTILHMKLVDVSTNALEADRSVPVPMDS